MIFSQASTNKIISTVQIHLRNWLYHYVVYRYKYLWSKSQLHFYVTELILQVIEFSKYVRFISLSIVISLFKTISLESFTRKVYLIKSVQEICFIVATLHLSFIQHRSLLYHSRIYSFINKLLYQEFKLLLLILLLWLHCIT